MQIQVYYFGNTYEHVPKHIKPHVTIEVPHGITVASILDILELPDHAVWLVSIANKQVAFDHIVVDGDTIEIFAPVSGG